MKNITFFLTFLVLPLLMTSVACQAQSINEAPEFKNTTDLKITSTNVVYDPALEQVIFTIQVAGKAGSTKPQAIGQMDGAPVLGYVFPTNLVPTDVGFSNTDGIVALALTSHPDFDDTPLWDENNNADYADDGQVWHPHWVVLTQDQRVAGGLAVKQFDKDKEVVKLPPTNPGMPMFMDSPGFPVITKGQTIKVIVPAYRMNFKTQFQFDAVTAYMQVNASQEDLPMLGVYTVYSIASGDLSLPYRVERQ